MFENTKMWLTTDLFEIVIYQDPEPIPGSSVISFAKAFAEDIKKIIKRL